MEDRSATLNLQIEVVQDIDKVNRPCGTMSCVADDATRTAMSRDHTSSGMPTSDPGMQVDPAEWDACATGSGTVNPFTLWSFFHALEESSSAVRRQPLMSSAQSCCGAAC